MSVRVTESSTPSRVTVTAQQRATVSIPKPSRGNAAGKIVSIPESQLYYWTTAWQRDEAEARAELDAGQGVRFEDSTEALRWLLSELPD